MVSSHTPPQTTRCSMQAKRYCAAIFFCLLASFQPLMADQDRPNILWITSEDNGPELGCYGDGYADTPNIDALAKKSLRYKTCWSNAPVCAPARTTIISGMYATSLGGQHMRSGIKIPTQVKLYPQLLRESGYYTSNRSKTDYNFDGEGGGWNESGRNAHWRNRPNDETPFFSVFNLTVSHESKIRSRPHQWKHDPAAAPLPAYHPDTPEEVENNIVRLMAKLPTICAFSYKQSVGQPHIYPRSDLTFAGNFLHMMFATPAHDYLVDPDFAEALNLLLIVHADHEQNCSTSTVRMVGSSNANLFASISAGIGALWGPLHGGANEACVNMLDRIASDGGNVQKYVDMAKDKQDGFRLMGFGHRVYKNFDPRAKIIKKAADQVLNDLGIDDPILEIAKSIEEKALNDEYFIEKKLYPNVDFYSGIIYRALGIPTEMFTVMFALGRIPGWIAQ